MNISEFLTNTEAEKVPDYNRPKNFDSPQDYIIVPALLSAAKVAIFLGQPLLLTGDAGTGKTQLAMAIAHKFGLGEVEVFNTKSSSIAKDLLYRYDNLAHFHHVQTGGEKLNPELVEQKFITYVALGKAIKESKLQAGRKIVLIDEIDKAPRDLPNDILDVMERMHFEVPEIGRTENNAFTGDAKNRPIVIMTSNSEKNLPEAFLRRCVFYHIKFPKPDELLSIMQRRLPNTGYTEPQWLKLINHFMWVRGKCKIKQPATAELIHWAAVLRAWGFDPSGLAAAEYTGEGAQTLRDSYAILAKIKDDWNALVKND